MYDLREQFYKPRIDYKALAENSAVVIYNPEEKFDINFLITVRKRKEFSDPMYSSFCEARDKSNLKICYTIIEYSPMPDHAKFCKKNKINYIWIRCKENDLFNKCLAYNMGVLYSNDSKYILFHDIDCLIQSDFFINLHKNIESKNCKAIQCFQQRRVLYCNEELSKEIIEGCVKANDLSLEHVGVDFPRLNGEVMLGAPGGSILVERGLFFDIGGYSEELFAGNSPEDSMMWAQIDTLDKMHISDDPPIDIFHLYHPPTYLILQPSRDAMEQLFTIFKNLSKDQKMGIINNRSEHFKKFRK